MPLIDLAVRMNVATLTEDPLGRVVEALKSLTPATGEARP